MFYALRNWKIAVIFEPAKWPFNLDWCPHQPGGAWLTNILSQDEDDCNYDGDDDGDAHDDGDERDDDGWWVVNIDGNLFNITHKGQFQIELVILVFCLIFYAKKIFNSFIFTIDLRLKN